MAKKARDLARGLDMEVDAVVAMLDGTAEVEVAGPTEAQTKEAVRIIRKANDMTLPMAKGYVAERDAVAILESAKGGIEMGLTEEEVANKIVTFGLGWAEVLNDKVEEPVVDSQPEQEEPTPEPKEEVQPEIPTGDMERANKLTLQTEGGVLVARFYRTHKLVRTLDEADLGFESDSDEYAELSKLEIRELFRQQVIARANEFGVEYDPVNRGQATTKFTDLDVLAGYAMEAVQDQIRGLDWAVTGVSTDGFTELTRYNGRTVTSKYANGTIAYASGIISLTVVNNQSGAQGMIDVDVLVVSGQYKKPRKFVFKGEEYNMSGAGLLKAMSTIVDGADEGK